MATKGKEQPQPTEDTEGTVQQPAPQTRLDQTVPGGRYLVNGRLVNANGEPLPDQAQNAQQSGG